MSTGAIRERSEKVESQEGERTGLSPFVKTKMPECSSTTRANLPAFLLLDFSDLNSNVSDSIAKGWMSLKV